jgi:ParB family transcriptional regulator, chromosome partitioning protein
MEKKGLGRGLSALLADIAPAEAAPEPGRAAPAGTKPVPIELIQPNPQQPRRHFGEKELQELASSIREKGVIQPLILRPHPAESGRYEIVAGERRWRAAQLAGVHALPALVRDLDDTEVLELAIIENIQRADLNALEEAQGYRQLMDRFGHTQEKLAEALGKSRSHIANLLAPADPARAGAGAAARRPAEPRPRPRARHRADPAALARQVVEKDLSVRQTEALARETAPRPARPPAARDADTVALERDLAANIGLSVRIEHKAGGAGELRIAYGTLEELDRLCQLLSR